MGNPDRLLARILPACGWLFSRWAVACGVLIICAGLAVILTNWDRFVSSSHMIFAPDNWLSLGIAWIVLKLVHELAHALSCKRHGGEVRETGLIFILFAPAAYVDVTSCWRFPSKWQRIHVAAAGMYAELVIAGLAALIWQQSDSTIVRHGLFNIILMASVSTLLFNANPLMRFDGYYLLADLVGDPQLVGRGFRGRPANGQTAVLGHAGHGTCSSRLAGQRDPNVRAGCHLLEARRFRVADHRFGLVVARSRSRPWLHGCGRVVRRALHKLLRECYRQYHEAPQVLIRSSVVATALLSLLAAVLAWMPWPGTVTAPAIVEYTDLSIVRCGAAGFVEKILVHDGQQVAAGELLAELRNDELDLELRDLELEAAQAELLHRMALNERDAGRVQIALRNQQAIAERLQELRDKHAHLRVHAPVAGRVVARNLKNLVDTYVSEGTELLAIGDERWKELRLSISHDEVADIQSLVGQQVRFRLDVGGLHQGTLTRIEPRASRQLPHPALSATVGGPLAVEENAESSTSKAPQLVAPRFPAVVTITPAVGDILACGDRGYALLGRYHESVGTHLWRRMTLWFDRLGAMRPD